MGYVIAAGIGALLVLVLRAIARRRRFAPWSPRTDADSRFRRFSNLIVPDERGTTEVDEIVVTPAGVFVIEHKDFGAWIYGDERDEYWTAVYPNERHRFQNPIRQNYRHIKALEWYLGIRQALLHSVVAFTQRSRLVKPMPPEVISSDPEGYVRAHDGIALSPLEFDGVCARLETLAVHSGREVRDAHIEQLRERFDSRTQCPRCSGYLVERRSRKPGYENSPFLGCSNYPRCRYIQSLEA
jgi:restriction system protein